MLASLLGVRASGCSAGCNGPHKPADDATSPPTRTADRSPACARSEALCSSGGSRVPGGGTGSGLSVRFRTVGTSGNNSAPRRTIRLLTQNHHAVHAKFGTRGSVPWTHCGERPCANVIRGSPGVTGFYGLEPSASALRPGRTARLRLDRQGSVPRAALRPVSSSSATRRLMSVGSPAQSSRRPARASRCHPHRARRCRPRRAP